MLKTVKHVIFTAFKLVLEQKLRIE